MTDNGHQVGESGQVEGLSWNNYDIHVHFEHDQDRRRAKYHLQDVITGKILPADSRLALCLKRRRTGLNVNVVYSNKSKQSHYKNLWLCESSWACPICSGYKEGKRRKKMSSALADWKGSVFMGVFTVQHKRADSLAEVKGRLYDAYGHFASGRRWKKIRESYSIIGNVVANEVTWSEDNGWHPHRHVLYISERVLSDQEIGQFEAEIKELFYKSAKAKGGYSSMEVGVKVTARDKDEAIGYCYKWGVEYEVLSWNSKQANRDEEHGGGYGPFELADLYASTGDQKYRMLFREYYEVYKGRDRTTSSKGLEDRLNMEHETDAEIMSTFGKDEQDERLAGVLSWDAFKLIGQKHRRGEFLEIMTAFIRQTITAVDVINFLLELGLHVSSYDDGVVMIKSLLERDDAIHGIGEFDIDVGQLLEHIQADDRMRLTGDDLQGQVKNLVEAVEYNAQVIDAILDLQASYTSRGDLQTLSEWSKEARDHERWLEHKFDILKERHHNYLAECIMLGAMVGAVQDRKPDRT